MRGIVMILSLSLTVLCKGYTQETHEAQEILKRMDKVMMGAVDKQGEMRITLTSKTGKEKIREAKLYQKGRDKRLTVYTQPESQAGISTLTLPGDIVWLYMPALGGPKKISVLAKSQAFNNTDFSIEDMASTPFSDRYDAHLLSSISNTHQLELIPKIEKSSYSKIIVSTNKEIGYPVSMDYYDRGGNKFKRAEYRYSKSGGYWNADEVVMTNIKKEHSTKIEIYNVLFDQGIDEGLFEVENLKPPKN